MFRLMFLAMALTFAWPVAAQDLPLRGVSPLSIDVDGRALPQLDADVVAVPVFGDEDPLATALKGAGPELTAAVNAVRAQRALAGELAIASIFGARGLATPRLLLVQAGSEQGASEDRLRRLAGAVVRAVRGQQVRSVALFIRGRVPGADAARVASEGAVLAHFDPGLHKSGSRSPALATLRLAGIGASSPTLTAAIERGRINGDAQNFARSIIQEPSNHMTPEHMAQHARRVARESNLEVEIFDEKQIAAMGMGGIIAVGKGAADPPRFIVLRYRAPQSSAVTLALAGKGVTFDSGGITLKPGANMYQMKGDMAGGAAVLAAMQIVGRTRPSVNVIGLVPAVMNLPSGTAQRPGDVWTGLSGKTVEVLSTDAEGRMILSDALTYALRQNATHLVDVATLTGAIVTALGDVHTGAFASDDALFAALTASARRTGESFWRMPIDEEYARGIRSSLVADLNETGGQAGASVGAKFLQQFTDGKPWIHLDIAGTSWPASTGPHLAAGPTGVTSRTLAELAHTLGSVPATR
jgi:leucyl aminopeptidase